MNVTKVVIFSALVSINVLIWYEVLGIGFLVLMGVLLGVLVVFIWRRR